MSNGNSEKSGIVCLLLLLLVGWLGAHRFYAGKIGTAILFIITAGGMGIWALIDLIMIIMGKFTDADGNAIALSN
ncbi:MAG: TM2 domain-containing protein [Planctomycetota bacterium]|jgi:TM2 domain-containing membrane protein YozV